MQKGHIGNFGQCYSGLKVLKNTTNNQIVETKAGPFGKGQLKRKVKGQFQMTLIPTQAKTGPLCLES